MVCVALVYWFRLTRSNYSDTSNDEEPEPGKRSVCLRVLGRRSTYPLLHRVNSVTLNGEVMRTTSDAQVMERRRSHPLLHQVYNGYSNDGDAVLKVIRTTSDGKVLER